MPHEPSAFHLRKGEEIKEQQKQLPLLTLHAIRITK
jgi:hypothetical protein